MAKSFWKPGDKTKVAALCGLMPNHLSQILNRARGVSPERAKALEAATRQILFEPIGWEEWLFNRTTYHPAFRGKRGRR